MSGAILQIVKHGGWLGLACLGDIQRVGSECEVSENSKSPGNRTKPWMRFKMEKKREKIQKLTADNKICQLTVHMKMAHKLDL